MRRKATAVRVDDPATARRAAWLALLALSVVLHLVNLGGRSLHHDESIHAKLSWDLATRGAYHYDPTYHGPLLYYLTAVTFLVHDSDFTARLPIAIAGIAMLWVAWRLRRPFGDRAAWWTGLLLTVSPLYLFFGRFLRQDLLELLTASAALVAFYPLARRTGPRVGLVGWVSLGFWTGLAFATTEVAYVTVALLGASTLALGVTRGLRVTVPLALTWLRQHAQRVATSLAVFVLVTVPVYTVGFTRPGDWCFPWPALTYWWGQHEIERVGGPWWFHLPRLAQYELLTLVCATVWVARRWRRLRPVEELLFFFGVGSIALYCYLGEKVPWLGVHQVWPLLPLAGAQLARTFSPRGRWWSRVLATAGIAVTVATSLVATFVLDEITPRQARVESLHFVQTCPEVKSLVREGLALSGSGTPVVAVSGEAAWPLSWYWRSLPVRWGTPEPGSRVPLVVCDPGTEADLTRLLGPGYTVERIPLRAWWLMEHWHPGTLTFLEWLRTGANPDRLPATRAWAVARYLVTRLPWSAVGSTDVVVLRNTGEAAAVIGREGTVPEELARALGAVSARVLGEGWLSEPRGVALTGNSIAVADAGLSVVRVFDREGHLADPLDLRLQQPEAVAWAGDGSLVVADTWNHRVVLEDPVEGAGTVIAEPEGRWYGPRAVAVSLDGRVAVTDTGNRRLVLFGPALEAPQILDASSAGGLLEPGGLAFVDHHELLVCDTGNRRLLVLTLGGTVTAEVPLPEAWSDYYSRPQAVVLSPREWLVSDTPGRSLWLIRDGSPERLDLGEAGIQPTGLAWEASSRTLVVADLTGAVWVFDLAGGEAAP